MKNTFIKYIWLLLCLSHLACSKKKEYKLQVKLLKLNEAELYDAKLVGDVLFDAQELDVDSLKNKSRALFLKGIDLYRNKKQPALALRHFKSSILVFPDAKTYFELGNALTDVNTENSLKEALQAYTVAERIRFQPASSIAFKEATVYARSSRLISDKNEKEQMLNQCVNALYTAFVQGYTDTAGIKKDPYLSKVAALPSYKRMLLSLQIKQLKTADGDQQFSLFKNAFPSMETGFTIGADEVEMKKYRESISYEFARFIPEMQNSSFGRDVSHDFFYVGKVKETEVYTALVYTSVSFEGEAMQPVRTTLAVYDNKTGGLLYSKNISCQCSADRIRSTSVSDGEIVLEDLQRQWEKPITSVSFDENKIVGHTSLSKATLVIQDNGLIEVKQSSGQFSDSLLMAVQP